MRIQIVMLFVRLLLGLIFFWQGLGKIFSWGIDAVYNNSFKPFEDTFLPEFLLKSVVYFTSFVEFLGGFLLIIGLFRKQVYYLFAVLLLIVAFGHGLQSPIWDLQHVVFRSILLVFLMMLFDKDSLSLDRFIKKFNIKNGVNKS
jgi:uncharacterized membrane protein YphA (DoxX/SURF4 family)